MLLGTSALRRMLLALLGEMDRIQEKNGETAVAGRPYREVRVDMIEQIDIIARAARKVQAITQELNDFARKEADRLTGNVDVNKVVRDAVALLGPMIKETTDDFGVEYASSLPAVAGNAQRLEQVVVNLVSNACQALPGRDRAVLVRTFHDEAEGRVRIAVTDHGVGIRPEDLERIKDPFFTTRRVAGGTGLGLSVSDKIVRAHDGELIFESAEGRGTTATVLLPCARTAEGEGTR
jgi:polar amino acid transport system substrate-binding protein